MVAGLAWMPAEVPWPGDLPALPRDGVEGLESEFGLMLESDLIASGPTLNYHAQLSLPLLVELAGLGPDALPTGDWKCLVRSESTVVYAFNEAGGLPMAPVVGIRRGSVIRVRGRGAHALRDRLALLPALGERTWRGFGRFRLDFDPRVADAPADLLARARDLADGFAWGASSTQWQGLREAALGADSKAVSTASFARCCFMPRAMAVVSEFGGAVGAA